MPPSRSDRRLLIVTTLALVVAGVAVAAALLLVTSNNPTAGTKQRLVYLGPEKDRRAEINLGSPLYIANPFGKGGIWLDLENGDFVALKVTVPNTTDCAVRWKGAPKSYVDCHGDLISSKELDRYTIIHLRTGPHKGGIVVNLRKLEPAPGL